MTISSDPSDIFGEEDETHVRAGSDVLGQVFLKAPFAMMLVDGTQKVRGANRAAARLFGCKLGELTEARLSDLFQQPDILFEKANSSGEVTRMLIKKDKRVFPARIQVQKLSDKNEDLALVSVLDIIEWREERQVVSKRIHPTGERRRRLGDTLMSRSAKMEAIGSLSAGIAHDFNNLLFPIMSYCEMCMTQVHENPEKARQYLGEILKASQRAGDLVRQILFFSHQEEKKPGPLQIQPIVKECVSFLRATIPAYIHFSIQVRGDVPQVMADPARLHQMIMNLCINAFHAMNETGGTLGISVEGVCTEKPEPVKDGFLPPGKYVRIQVSDTGQGIDPEIMERIFDPYFTTKPFGTGTGMGLSVVREIVKAYKGYIRINSKPGKGAVFRVYLPRAPISLTKNGGPKTALPKTGKGSILLVDNEALVRESLEISLGALGYRVFSHCLGKEALTAIKKAPGKFDLLITGMITPDLTGLGLVREIKKTAPDMPVILCTGFCDAKFEKQHLKAGISACLHKPVTRKDLAEAVHQTLFAGRTRPGKGKAVNQ